MIFALLSFTFASRHFSVEFPVLVQPGAPATLEHVAGVSVGRHEPGIALHLAAQKSGTSHLCIAGVRGRSHTSYRDITMKENIKCLLFKEG